MLLKLDMNTRIKILSTILLVFGISWLAYSGIDARREQAKYASLKAVITDAREMKIYGRGNNGFRAKKPLAILSSDSHPQMFDMIKRQSSYDSRMVACSAELLITVTEQDGSRNELGYCGTTVSDNRATAILPETAARWIKKLAKGEQISILNSIPGHRGKP